MNKHKLLFAVGIGGAIGAISRYTIAQLLSEATVFPTATLLVNLIGSFLLCFILFQPSIKQRMEPWLFTGVTTGIIGSFTTFSAIIVELINLSQAHIGLALIYLSATIVGGLLCCLLGYKLARQ